jgi:hypothetical protein
MTRANRYSLEVRERAVRMLHEQEPFYASRWAALTSIAGKDRLYGGDVAQVGSAGGGNNTPTT